MTKIQVIPFANGMGDLLRHEPLLRGIKEKFPDSHLSVFCQKNGEILSRVPFIDQIFSMWCSRCDYIFNCNFSVNSVLEQVFSDKEKGKFKELIGFHSESTNASGKAKHEFLELQKWELGFDEIYKRRLQYSLNLSEWLCKFCDVFPVDPKVRFYFREQDEQFAKDYLKKIDKPLVVIHPLSEGKVSCGGNYIDHKTFTLTELGNKDWQPEKFIEFINKIKNNFHVILIGEKKDGQILREISSQTDCDISLKSLFTNLALIKYAKYFIGVDSCPAHVAQICDIPSLIIACHALYYACYPVAPKVKHVCVHEPETVKRINVDTIYNAFLKLQNSN